MRYALIHEDFNRWVMPDYNFNIYADSLFKSNSMGLAEKIGPLDFYENDKYLPKIYAAQKSFLLAGDETSFPALSLTGHLNSPFLVMAGDIGVKGIENVLESVDGIVFYNSNAVDLVCDLLEKSYSLQAQESLRFSAPEEGLYYVFVKETSGRLRIKNGKPETAASGLKWRKTGETVLKKGVQPLEFEGAGPGQIALIVPAARFRKVESLIKKKLWNPEIDVAYVFSSDAEKRAEVSLEGESDYILSLNIPVQHSKKKVNAWKNGVLKMAIEEAERRVSDTKTTTLEYYGKDTRKPQTIDIGEYPKLVLNNRDLSKKKVMISLDLLLDGKTGHEKMSMVEAMVSADGEIDLSEIAKKRYAAGEYRLKKVELAVSEGGGEMKLPHPELVGEFGLKKSTCKGAGERTRIGDRLWAVAASKCGEWSEESVVKPGRYYLKNRLGASQERLVLLRKKMRAEYVRRNAQPVEFEKINPTKYLIRPGKGVRKLVFSDSFNSGWSLRANGVRFSHFKTNGYANGFILPDDAEVLTLEYAPQRFFDFSKLASLVALAGVVAAGVVKGGKNGKGL